jgi:hypothetical protein
MARWNGSGDCPTMPFGSAPPRSLGGAARLVLLETAVAILVIMSGRLNLGLREALLSALPAVS